MPQRSGALPRGVVVLVGLAAATIASIGFSSIRGILAPVLLTLVLAICTHPVRVRAQARGMPQGLATASMMVVMFGLLAGFGATVLIAVGQFIDMLPQYAGQFEQIARDAGAWLSTVGIGTEQSAALAAQIDPGNVAAFLTGALGGVFNITGALVIVLTMMILMSADAVYVPTILAQLAPRKPHLVMALAGYAEDVRRYMVVTTLLGLSQQQLPPPTPSSQ